MVGNDIKGYLRKNGISQSFLSEKTGISSPKINMALNEKRQLTLEEYALICGALNLNTDFFLKPRLPNARREK